MMFTGIIKEIGKVRSFKRAGTIWRLVVESNLIRISVAIGDSVSVNGVCLTAVTLEKKNLSFDIMAETIRSTNLASLRQGDTVNLEGSLKAGDPLGGHFVSGHIDCIGTIRNVQKTGEDVFIEIEIPKGYSDLIVQKGSIALDGVSLTIGKVEYSRIILYIIPHTLQKTTLGTKRPGDKVNVEFDLIGKHVARMIKEKEHPSAITENFLRQKGF